MSTFCTVPKLFLRLGSCAAHITIGNLAVSVGAAINCLILAGACSVSCGLGLVRMHYLPVTGRFASSQRLDRADRICSHCANGSVADELHVVFACIAAQPLRHQYATVFTDDTDTIKSYYRRTTLRFSISYLSVVMFMRYDQDCAGVL